MRDGRVCSEFNQKHTALQFTPLTVGCATTPTSDSNLIWSRTVLKLQHSTMYILCTAVYLYTCTPPPHIINTMYHVDNIVTIVATMSQRSVYYSKTTSYKYCDVVKQKSKINCHFNFDINPNKYSNKNVHHQEPHNTINITIHQ